MAEFFANCVLGLAALFFILSCAPKQAPAPPASAMDCSKVAEPSYRLFRCENAVEVCFTNGEGVSCYRK